MALLIHWQEYCFPSFPLVVVFSCLASVTNFQMTPPHILPLLNFSFAITDRRLTLSLSSASPLFSYRIDGLTAQGSEQFVSVILGFVVQFLSHLNSMSKLKQDTIPQLLLSAHGSINVCVCVCVHCQAWGLVLYMASYLSWDKGTK